MPRSTPRIGIGFDTHRFADGRTLVLGGVQIPFARGLEGHSDADVLLHAIADSLLGAAALGDIGKHFPNSDPQFKGISSLKLLHRVRDLIREEGYTVVNVDSMLILELPKVLPYIDKMRSAVADALEIDMTQVSIKATTNEGMGHLGRQEGVAAHAVACIQHHFS
ncbi:MAG TPA: 2-C-methyl-D-erythritol 2,4-cyclodiphosphate synthase [Bacteroidota bacterium]